ncbi:MAG: hypothetical protein ACOVS5_08105 [Oligoflexus sp.]|jgi:pre-rRNA-processing protein TSR3
MLTYDIIVDHTETANKCTILPLSYRSDFRIARKPKAFRWTADLLLHPEGQSLADFCRAPRPVRSLAAVDCVWRRLEPILRGIEGTPPHFVKIPEEFVTAYPRVSRKDFDPEGGLATIEAIFIAAAFVGVWDPSLLREYFFAERFLTINIEAFRHFGIEPEIPEGIFAPYRPRNAQTRRLGRGRSAPQRS